MNVRYREVDVPGDPTRGLPAGLVVVGTDEHGLTASVWVDPQAVPQSFIDLIEAAKEQIRLRLESEYRGRAWGF